MSRFAFVFPGQGSQKVGMLSDMASEYPIVEKTFYIASMVLGYDLWEMVQKESSKELNKTWKAQPALLTASVALWHVWKQKVGKIPRIMAGHSLGEYTALVCADVIKFTDAVRLVEMRGRLMQEAAPESTGAMTAILGLDIESVIEACKVSSKNQLVSLANINSPDQIVISGHKEAVDHASMICKSAGAKRILSLPISVPSHCMLMKTAAQKLSIELKKIRFNTPTIPVVNNVDVKCETSPDAIRNALSRQLYNPVQWDKIVKFISKYGVEHLYEVGPGNVLSSLTKRIVNTLTASVINTPKSIFSALM